MSRNLRCSLLSLLLITIGLLSFYIYYDIYIEGKPILVVNENVDKEELKVDFTKIQQQNSNISSALEIKSIELLKPINYTTNNKYYLTHNYKNEYDTYGSIFLDYRNDITFNDDISIIYGHSVPNSNVMFSSLYNIKSNEIINIYFEKEKETMYIVEQNISINAHKVILDNLLINNEYLNMLGVQYNKKKKYIVLVTCDLDYGLNSEYRRVVVASTDKE